MAILIIFKINSNVYTVNGDRSKPLKKCIYVYNNRNQANILFSAVLLVLSVVLLILEILKKKCTSNRMLVETVDHIMF